MPGDCLFCRIARKEIPATLVYESDAAVAFRDIKPQAPVHVLVVPKQHVESVSTLPPDSGALLAKIHEAIQKVAKSEGVDQSGFRVVVNNGKDADQSVAHLHYHVLGKRKLGWPPG